MRAKAERTIHHALYVVKKSKIVAEGRAPGEEVATTRAKQSSSRVRASVQRLS